MSFRSINPKNGKLLKTYETISNHHLQDKLEQAHKAYKFMRN